MISLNIAVCQVLTFSVEPKASKLVGGYCSCHYCSCDTPILRFKLNWEFDNILPIILLYSLTDRLTADDE